jgi:molybdate transport system substrate-binding protein
MVPAGESQLTKEPRVHLEPIKILSSMATREVLSELAQRHGRDTGQPVELESAGGVAVAQRVQSGESVDVVVLAAAVIDRLTAEGKLQPGSRVDIARSGIGMAVGSGKARPDVGSGDAVKAAVLAARTVGYSTGPSGNYLLQLFERWGIAGQLAGRIVQAPPGVPVASLVAGGEVELGFQQLSELMNVAGIDVLGPLPDDIQSITVFSGAVSSGCSRPEQARALLAYLAGPEATACKRANGMDAA